MILIYLFVYWLLDCWDKVIFIVNVQFFFFFCGFDINVKMFFFVLSYNEILFWDLVNYFFNWNLSFVIMVKVITLNIQDQKQF